MAEYTYLACDWVTHAIIDELPLAGVSLGDPLNKGATLSINMSTETDKASIQRDATAPYRTLLFVERNGLFIWGGWCWQRSWSSSSKKYSLGYGQFDTYFDQREIYPSVVYSATDQLAIARNLIDVAQAGPGGNIGVTHGNPAATSGVLRDREYKAEEQKMVGASLQQLAAVEGGFDFHYDIERDPGTGLAAVKFYTFYPYRGLSPQTSQLIFEYPGNVESYDWSEGGTFATRTHEVGGQPEAVSPDQEAGGVLQSFILRSDLISQGYPLIDQTVSRNDIIIQSTLDDHTVEDARLAASIDDVPSITVDPSADPVYGTYVTGDYAKLIINDPLRFPDGMEAWVRIVDRQLTTSAPGSRERLKLVLEKAEVPA